MNQKYDLTNGGIIGKLLLVAMPIMGTQLMQMAYNLTDMFWLGRVGSDVVAASGTAGMYLWLSNALLLIGRMGAEIGVSQQLGRGDRDAARRYSQNALFLSVVLGLGFGALILLFSRPLIGFFAIQESHVAGDAADYLRITAVGIPFTFISAAIAGSFNASGNSRTPFFTNAAGLVFNMTLDPLLIFGMRMGIHGAAIATVLAQIIVCALSVAGICWHRTRPLDKYAFHIKPDGAMVRQIFRWSIPVGMESLFFTLLSMIIARFIASFGADAIAVQRVGSQVESLSWLIAGGFSSALTAFVGQNYGAGKWSRIHRSVRVSVTAMTIWGLAVTVLLFFAGGALFRVFLPEPGLVQLGVDYLRILSLCQLVAMLEGVGAGGFRGVGKTLPPSMASISSNAFRVVLTYVLSRPGILGLNGIWWGITIGACIRGLWIFFWFILSLRGRPREDIPPAAVV